MVVHLPPAPSDAATVGSQTLVESRNPRAPFFRVSPRPFPASSSPPATSLIIVCLRLRLSLICDYGCVISSMIHNTKP